MNRHRVSAGFSLLLAAITGWGPVALAARPSPIPRTASQQFRTEGLFEGGTQSAANLEAMRLSQEKGIERWEVDFSDNAKREVGKVAPQFQIRYLPGDDIMGSDGELILSKPAKFIVTLRSIRKNYLQRNGLQELVEKSKLVKDIVVYPPLEDGDMAIELILHNNVEFETHQPMQKEGRLVLDLKKRKS